MKHSTQCLRILTAAAMIGATQGGQALSQPCDDARLLSTPSPSMFGAFGHALAVSDDTLIVGEPAARISGSTPRGAVHFYYRVFNSAFTKTYSFSSVDLPEYSRLGSSLSISGDYAVAGLPGYSVPGFPNLGVVAVFHRTNTGWGIQTYVFSPINAPEQSFGVDVALHGNSLVVGASGHDSMRGIAYLFERVGTSWVLRSTLNPPIGRSAQGQFGASVAIGDSWLLVGSPRYDTPGGLTSAGSLHFYRHNGSTAQWAHYTSGVASDDQLGSDVAVTPTHVLAGWPGQHSVIRWATVGDLITQQMVISAPPDSPTRNYQQMGTTFALSPDGSRLVMNSPSSIPRLALQYRLDSSQAVFEGEHHPSTADGGNLGQGLAMFNDQVVLGSEFSSASGQLLGGAVSIRPMLPGSIESPCSPMVITETGSRHFCTANAPVVPTPEGCSNSENSPSHWYLFNPTCPGRFIVSAERTAFPTVLAAYSGSCDDRMLLQCAAGPATLGLSTALIIDATDGPVLLRISGADGAAGMYTLTIDPLSPSNDVCYDAVALEPGTYPICNQNAGSEEIQADVYCSPRQKPANDLWYTFTPTCSGIATVAAYNNTFDTVLAAYTGNCFDGYSIIGCNDDSYPYGTGSMVQFAASAGVTYTLRLGAYDEGGRGHADLSVDFVRGCAADFNFDGGVDGADVSEFFVKWEAGEPCADVNEDGGVDGADVSWFFSLWEAGGC